ncbi:MAG TPA: twin-arginine translocase TatA/TatE family subunit [Rubellimicrobium sp.]|nr:twin-arginine translocase TatA/TatE family subunit [Rubellimicrobium sp.]
MLNNIGPMGFIIIAVVVLVLFGRGKISGVMGEVGKGITAFRKGMDDGKREIEDASAAQARDVTPSDTARVVRTETVVRDSELVQPVNADARDRV